jgi:hypothetical protein
MAHGLHINSPMRLLPLVLAATLAASGCSLGRYIDDKTIAYGVKGGLAGRRAPAMATINVDVFEGTVYLTGDVDSAEEKSGAEISARSIDGVELVVNDVRVTGGTSPSALVSTHGRNPLLDRLSGIARLDPPAPGDPRGPSLAYDRAGRLVATVYTVPMVKLGHKGFDELRASSRPIDHVSVRPIVPEADVPEPQYEVILWHVSAGDAAQLR